MIEKNRPPDRGIPSPVRSLGGAENREGIEGALHKEGIAGLPERIQRYSKAKRQSVAIIDYAREHFKADPNKSAHGFADAVKRRAAAEMSRCGGYLVFRHYLEPDKVKLHSAQFCDQHLVCPVCAIRRGSRNGQAYMRKVQALDQAGIVGVDQMVTLTVRNGEDLYQTFKHLDRSRKVLTDRMRKARLRNQKTTFSGLIAAVGSYEVTNIGNGWHPHIHIWVRSERLIDVEELRAEWLKITGDSNQVKVSPIYGEPHEAFMEIFKYATKFSGLSPALVWEVYQELKGKRLIFSLGELRGVQLPESLLDEPLEGPWQDYLYHWLAAVGGYSLSTSDRGWSGPFLARSDGS